MAIPFLLAAAAIAGAVIFVKNMNDNESSRAPAQDAELSRALADHEARILDYRKIFNENDTALMESAEQDLMAMNEEYVAWLRSADGKISEPVVDTNDPAYHAVGFSRQASKAGCPFSLHTDYTDTGKLLTIYANSFANSTAMFSPLAELIKQENKSAIAFYVKPFGLPARKYAGCAGFSGSESGWQEEQTKYETGGYLALVTNAVGANEKDKVNVLILKEAE